MNGYQIHLKGVRKRENLGPPNFLLPNDYSLKSCEYGLKKGDILKIL